MICGMLASGGRTGVFSKTTPGEVRTMAGKEIMDKLSIYIPQRKMEEKPVDRLMRLGSKRDRSVNYLVVEAILQYLDREENQS
jgi:hypothetical protein